MLINRIFSNQQVIPRKKFPHLYITAAYMWSKTVPWKKHKISQTPCPGFWTGSSQRWKALQSRMMFLQALFLWVPARSISCWGWSSFPLRSCLYCLYIQCAFLQHWVPLTVFRALALRALCRFLCRTFCFLLFCRSDLQEHAPDNVLYAAYSFQLLLLFVYDCKDIKKFCIS